ncbi:hypothetical protein PDQ37_25540 [Bacillus cereus]|nr:hypothetical protein [Bacillus cereus]
MLLGNPYAIDLGNGFTKRASKKNKSLEADVITELSVLAPVDDYYNEASFTKIELTNTDFPYYIGEEARKSKLPLIRALGENKRTQHLRSNYLDSLQKTLKRTLQFRYLLQVFQYHTSVINVNRFKK